MALETVHSLNVFEALNTFEEVKEVSSFFSSHPQPPASPLTALYLGKVEISDACIPISEDELNQNPKLRKAIESAMNTGSAIVEISNGESKSLQKYYGKCVIYRGYGFEILLAVT
mgnify:CR=1 FL=1